MRILAIETSGGQGGIALADGPNLIEEVRLEAGLHHGRDLIAAAKEACKRAGWSPREIDVAAVSIGPGSFTGIRIAVTMAKFLAFDAGTKVVAVPSLRALAENAPPDRPRVVPIVDAKRGGLFAAIFERHEGQLAATFGPAMIEPEDLARRLESASGPAFILGHGLIKCRAALAAFDLAPEGLWDIRAATVARLGLELAARGEFVDPMRLEPIYIRPPEAEEIWERRKRKSP